MLRTTLQGADPSMIRAFCRRSSRRAAGGWQPPNLRPRCRQQILRTRCPPSPLRPLASRATAASARQPSRVLMTRSPRLGLPSRSSLDDPGERRLAGRQGFRRHSLRSFADSRGLSLNVAPSARYPETPFASFHVRLPAVSGFAGSMSLEMTLVAGVFGHSIRRKLRTTHDVQRERGNNPSAATPGDVGSCASRQAATADSLETMQNSMLASGSEPSGSALIKSLYCSQPPLSVLLSKEHKPVRSCDRVRRHECNLSARQHDTKPIGR